MDRQTGDFMTVCSERARCPLIEMDFLFNRSVCWLCLHCDSSRCSTQKKLWQKCTHICPWISDCDWAGCILQKKTTSSLFRYQSHKGHRIDVQPWWKDCESRMDTSNCGSLSICFFLLPFTFGGSITDCIDFYAPVLQINETQTRN